MKPKIMQNTKNEIENLKIEFYRSVSSTALGGIFNIGGAVVIVFPELSFAQQSFCLIPSEHTISPIPGFLKGTVSKDNTLVRISDLEILILTGLTRAAIRRRLAEVPFSEIWFQTRQQILADQQY